MQNYGVPVPHTLLLIFAIVYKGAQKKELNIIHIVTQIPILVSEKFL